MKKTKIDIPYCSACLAVARMLMKITPIKIDESIEAELVAKFQSLALPENRYERNKKIANAHGISVKDLINSPNYKILVEEFHNDRFRFSVQEISKKAGITELQAWVSVANALNWFGRQKGCKNPGCGEPSCLLF